MSVDRVIHFSLDLDPSREDVQYVLEDFFGPIATLVEWKYDRFFVDLIGRTTNPLKRVGNTPIPTVEDRWIEVWHSKGYINVMTRLQDAAVSSLADGLVDVFVQHWAGELQE